MYPSMSDYWWLFLARGIIAVLIGVLALAVPGTTFTLLVILVGLYMFIDGVFAIVHAINHRKTMAWWGWSLFFGLVGVVVGLLVVSNPFAWVVALVYLVAVWALVTGAVEIVSAIRLRKVLKTEAWYILVGALTALFGLSLLFNPLAGVVTLAFVFGFYAIISGAMLVSLAFRLRRQMNGA
jgi:uncharacterized membrane protein HdeD (DUF308 family)